MVGEKKTNRRAERQNILKSLQLLKTWQLVTILILLIFVSATFLRLNNIGMVQRRDAVKAADEAGNNDVTRNRLYDLQRYSSAHMNASTGVIYLQGSFDRAWEKIQKRAEQSNSQGRENIYKRIEDEVCGPLARQNGWRWPDPRYISCERRELAKYPSGQELINQVDPPDRELFRHSFMSPRWSPDFAGFSILITALLLLVIIARFIGVMTLRLMLRMRH